MKAMRKKYFGLVRIYEDIVKLRLIIADAVEAEVDTDGAVAVADEAEQEPDSERKRNPMLKILITSWSSTLSSLILTK